VLSGNVPLLSIEITRECPLSCPGCYAYGESHLGNGTTLRELRDFRGDALVHGVLDLVRRHRPMHVSLVGGEPMVRYRELDRILPALSEMGVFAMVVTSAVIPIPAHWMEIPRTRIAVSVDGLPEHHDVRREPATYERILKNIAGRKINVHWVITRPMLARPGYLEEYVAFWNARPEVDHIWVSLYSPQMDEESPGAPDCGRSRTRCERIAAFAEDVSEAADYGRRGSRLRQPALESAELPVFQDVGELLRRSQKPRGTLCLRRKPGLQPVRMQHQQCTALDSERENCRAAPCRAHGDRLAWRRHSREPVAQ
jgi:organic radical activating enzyme